MQLPVVDTFRKLIIFVFNALIVYPIVLGIFLGTVTAFREVVLKDDTANTSSCPVVTKPADTVLQPEKDKRIVENRAKQEIENKKAQDEKDRRDAEVKAKQESEALAKKASEEAASKKRSKFIQSQSLVQCMDTVKNNAKYPSEVDFSIFKTDARTYEQFRDGVNRVHIRLGGKMMNGLGIMVPFEASCKYDHTIATDNVTTVEINIL